jgi:hypothetical protein
MARAGNIVRFTVDGFTRDLLMQVHRLAPIAGDLGGTGDESGGEDAVASESAGPDGGGPADGRCGDVTEDRLENDATDAPDVPHPRSNRCSAAF